MFSPWSGEPGSFERRKFLYKLKHLLILSYRTSASSYSKLMSNSLLSSLWKLQSHCSFQTLTYLHKQNFPDHPQIWLNHSPRTIASKQNLAFKPAPLPNGVLLQFKRQIQSHDSASPPSFWNIPAPTQDLLPHLQQSPTHEKKIIINEELSESLQSSG